MVTQERQGKGQDKEKRKNGSRNKYQKEQSIKELWIRQLVFHFFSCAGHFTGRKLTRRTMRPGVTTKVSDPVGVTALAAALRGSLTNDIAAVQLVQALLGLFRTAR